MENTPCQYCNKPKKKVECAKYANNDEDNFSFHEGITFILYVLSLFFPSFKKRLDNHKFKVTCTNKDCIDYLKGCYVNKAQKTIWDYEFPAPKDHPVSKKEGGES